MAFNPFGRKQDDLICISTNDVAPDAVKKDLVTAKERGKSLIEDFISTRLGPNASVDFFNPIKKNKSKTFEAISSEPPKLSSAPKVLKADRKIYHRLLSAASSGHDINLPNILKHELSPVPPSLASLDSQLHTTDKASLVHVIGDQFAKAEILQTTDKTCTLLMPWALCKPCKNPKEPTHLGIMLTPSQKTYLTTLMIAAREWTLYSTHTRPTRSKQQHDTSNLEKQKRFVVSLIAVVWFCRTPGLRSWH